MNPVAQYAVQRVPVDDVFVTGKRRELDDASVAALVESIKRHGLQTPITVRVDDTIPDPDTGEIMGGYALIAGRHRLEAFRRSGFDMIPAVIRECDEVEAELWEIAENLHRSDLTKPERDRQIRRYAELIEAREAADKIPQTAAFSKVGAGRGNKGIARKIADETGLSKDTVQRALNPQPPKPRPIAPAPVALNDIETQEQWLAAIMRVWNRGSREWRDSFLERVAELDRNAA